MNRAGVYFLALILLFYTCPGPEASEASGQPYPAYAEKEGEPLPLTLHEVLELAVLNNFDIQLAKYDRAISDADLYDAFSIYDTVMELDAEYTHTELQQTSSLAGTVSEGYEANVGASKLFRFGTDVEIDYNFSRLRTDSAFARINPAEESYIKFAFTQPLLKNVFGMNDWGDVRVTKIDVENYRSETIDTIEEELAGVEKAYWELLLRIRLADIREKMYERSEDFYEITEGKEQMGSAELTDLYAARANKKLREAELMVENANADSSQNALKLLVNGDEAVSAYKIVPTDTITVGGDDVGLIPALKAAFTNRRDYKRAKKEVEAKDIELKMKKNEMWPQLDLEGSFAINGIRRSFWGSVQDMTEETNTDYYAGVSLSVPLERRAEKSALAKARNEKAKALLDLKRIEKTIVSDVDSVVKLVNAYRLRAKEYTEIAELQKMKLEEEEKKYRYGRSDSDRIIRFQEDYLNAEIARGTALLDYREALIDLFLEQNTYLYERELTVK